MKRMFDFQCSCGNIEEKFISDAVFTVECSECGKESRRMIATPRINLEGITGDFPGAYAAWERKRKEALTVAQKRSYYNPAE